MQETFQSDISLYFNIYKYIFYMSISKLTALQCKPMFNIYDFSDREEGNLHYSNGSRPFPPPDISPPPRPINTIHNKFI